MPNKSRFMSTKSKTWKSPKYDLDSVNQLPKMIAIRLDSLSCTFSVVKIPFLSGTDFSTDFAIKAHAIHCASSVTQFSLDQHYQEQKLFYLVLKI